MAQRYGVNEHRWRNADARLPQIFNLWKTWYLWTAIKQCALKVPVVVPQRLPPPHHQNSWMCQVTRQRRMEVAMALRLLISWPHNRGESKPARQVQGNHRVLTGGGLRGVRGRCNVRRTSPTIAGVKGGGSQKWKQLLDAGKGKETDSSPGIPGKKHNPADILVLAQYNPCQTSALQNCRISNLCCFKPLFV